MVQVGFGSATTGGAGGTTYTVTSSADSGANTLRDAVEVQTGTRIIQFDPTIRDIVLSSQISIDDPNITIDGESAGGVQIRNNRIRVNDNNIILRHLKLRRGNADVAGFGESLYVDGDGASGISNIYIEHCEVDWATDENFQLYRYVQDCTIINCIVAQAFQNSPGTTNVARALMLNSTGGVAGEPPTRVSIFSNLLAYSERRMPLIADGKDIEVCNNFMIGSRDADSTFATWGDEHNPPNGVVGRVFSGYNHCQYTAEATQKTQGFMQVNTNSLLDYHAVGNLLWDQNGNPLNSGAYDPLYYGTGAGGVEETEPGWISGDHTTDVNAVRLNVLNNAGAKVDNRDTATQNIITNATNGANGLVDDVADAGGFPSQPPYTAGQTLSPPVFIDGDSFLSPSVATPPPTVQTISRAFFADAETFFFPSLDNEPTVQTVTRPNLDDSTDTFFAPSVAGQNVTLTAPYLDDSTDTIYSVIVEHELNASLFDDSTDTFYTIQLGWGLTTPEFFDDLTDVFYAPNVGEQILTASLYTDADTFFTHNMDLTISAALYVDPDTFPAHGIAALLDPPLLDDTPDTFYAAGTDFGINVGLYGDPDVFYGVTLSGGAVILPLNSNIGTEEISTLFDDIGEVDIGDLEISVDHPDP